MKRFILSAFTFLIIVVSFYAFLLGRYAMKMRSYGFQLPKEKTILVIGDSQTQACIDDDILYKVKNVSQFHDNYFTMYRRLQLYVEQNPQINMVILSFSPHTFAPYKDSMFNQFKYVQESTKYYLPYFCFEDWRLLLNKDLGDVLSALATPISFYWNVSKEYINQMGAFVTVDVCNLEKDVSSGAERLVPNAEEAFYGKKITVDYAHRIVDFCAERNIRFIGVSTPVYHGSDYFDMKNYSNLLETDFPNVEIWDDMNMEVPDSCRRDVNHLNRLGATLYSNVLKERMKSKDL